IYGYRMSLWAEHLGMLDETFKEPERLECVRKVNEIANNNWSIYSSEEMSLLHGHLLKYPVQIDSDGQISSLPECENFPDAGVCYLPRHGEWQLSEVFSFLYLELIVQITCKPFT
ncbi:phospholipase D delta-like protein, partial [Trifolium pratense]